MNPFVKIKNKILTGFFYAASTVCFRIKVSYVDPEQKKNPIQGIYICNHMSHYDGITIRTALKNVNLYSLVTTDWYNKKWCRALMFYEKAIPIDRDNPGTEWIHESRKVVKQGGSINIFPEGHTSKSENMNEFRPGFLMLASFIKDVPIIPVATVGKYTFFFGQRKRILVGKPIYFDKSKFSFEADALNAYAAEFRDVIKEMQEDLKEGKYK